MRLSYLYEGKAGSGVRDKKENPKAGGKEEEAEGKIALTVKQRPSMGASQSVYKEPRSA
jgi:hypothetical protein